jgi:DNA-binding transcriptional ArsR family regulator
MEKSDLATLESLFLALADKTRLRLLALMSDGEVSVGYLADKLGESQPKISRHLAYLRNAGLVSTRREGKWIYYNIETQSDAGAEDVLVTALEAMRGPNGNTRREATDRSDRPSSVIPTDTYADTYINDWEPAHIDIFLL